MIENNKTPEKLYLAFCHYHNDCIGYTDEKRIIKKYIKERGKNFFYMEVKKMDIPKVMDFLKNRYTLAEQIDVYTVDSNNNISNVLTSSEYEMFVDSFAYYMSTIYNAVDTLDKLLPYIRLTEKEEYILRYFFAIINKLDDDGYNYYNSSEISINEDRAVRYYIKNNLS